MEIIKEVARLDRKAPPSQQAAISPAAVLEAFRGELLDPDTCRDWLLRRLHPSGPVCPHCACPAVSRRKWQAFYAGSRIQCSKCTRFYKATTGTILESAKLSPAQIVLLALCLALDAPMPNTIAAVDATQNTVRLWRDRLEEASHA